MKKWDRKSVVQMAVFCCCFFGVGMLSSIICRASRLLVGKCLPLLKHARRVLCGSHWQTMALTASTASNRPLSPRRAAGSTGSPCTWLCVAPPNHRQKTCNASSNMHGRRMPRMCPTGTVHASRSKWSTPDTSNCWD